MGADLERSIRRPAFALGERFVARRDFVVNGHTFKIGDSFPWRRLAVSERILRQLWAQSYVDVDGPATLPPDAEPIVDSLFDRGADDAEPAKPKRKK